MKKKNIVIIVILVTILIGVSVFLLMQNSKQNERKYSIEKVEEFNYFILQNGEKYGVIGKDGNVIIEPTYQKVVIPNPSKAIFVCTPSESKTKVLNDKNEELFTEYEEVNSIKLKNIASNLVYEKSVLKYKKEGKYGLIDFTGKQITKPIYGSIDALEYKEGELIVEQDGKYGVININGATLVEPEYQTVKVDGYYTEENGYKNAGYIVGIKTDEGYRYGYIDINGKIILKKEFNEITRVSNIKDDANIYFIAAKNGQYGLYKNETAVLNPEYQSIIYNQTNNIFIVEKSRKFGVADINGKIIIDLKYTQIDITGKYLYAKEKQGETKVFDKDGKAIDLSANISKVSTADGKYNIVMENKDNQTLYSVEDVSGKQLIPSEYTYIEYLYDDYFTVCNKQGLLGVVDLSNNIKIDIKYNSVQSLKGTQIIQASITKENETTVYNKNFEEICKLNNASISQIGNYIKIYNNNDVYYLNKDGEKVESKQVYPNNQLYAKKENGKWGFVDKTGNVKINYQYDSVTELNEYGFAGICKDNKWGVIDRSGAVIQEPKYEMKEKETPTFLGKYYQVTFGFGEVMYSNN